MTQLDLFTLLSSIEDDTPAPPSIYGSPARGLVARTAAFTDWCACYGRLDSYRVSHAWHPGLCEAAGATPGCQVSVMTCELRCDHHRACECVGDLIEKGACLHCAWEGPDRLNQAAAVWDALDHAHPGWDDSPAVDPLRHDPAPNRSNGGGRAWRSCMGPARRGIRSSPAARPGRPGRWPGAHPGVVTTSPWKPSPTDTSNATDHRYVGLHTNGGRQHE